MEELTREEDREITVPRWVQVPAGLVIGLGGMLSGFGSVAMLIAPTRQNLVFTRVLGFVVLLGSLWLLEKSFRLVTGRRNKGGLMSPAGLRVLSYIMVVLPFAGIFTGHYDEFGWRGFVQGACYFLCFWRFRAMARRREAEASETGTG